MRNKTGLDNECPRCGARPGTPCQQVIREYSNGATETISYFCGGRAKTLIQFGSTTTMTIAFSGLVGAILALVCVIGIYIDVLPLLGMPEWMPWAGGAAGMVSGAVSVAIAFKERRQGRMT